MIRFLTGDCRELMRTLDEASVDAVITDPPYDLLQASRNGSGRSNEPDNPFGRHGSRGGGFMGMDWDATGVAFDPATWEAVKRVLKPGAFLLAMGGTRTFHRLTCAIEDAGFEVKDCLMWLYGSGFPKHKSLLKPAWEPVIVAKKPGAGMLNIEACRIGTSKDVPASVSRKAFANVYNGGWQEYGETPGVGGHDPNLGRWPANVALDSWDEQVARLRYNIPDDVQRVIREYFDGYGRLQAMRQEDRDAAQQSGSDEVLRAGVLCGVAEPEPQRRKPSHVRQEASAGLARQDAGTEAAEQSARPRESRLEGRAASGTRLCDDRPLHAAGDRTSSLPVDGNAQQSTIHPGTSPRDGEIAESSALAVRDRASQERDQGRQSAGEPRDQGQRRPQEGTLASALRASAPARRERTIAVPALLVLECDIPHGWRHYFELTGLTVPSPDSAAALLDEMSGERRAAYGSQDTADRYAGSPVQPGIFGGNIAGRSFSDAGGASRFFYTAKASSFERNKGLDGLPMVRPTDGRSSGLSHGTPEKSFAEQANHHPTVKPLALMQWLVRLVAQSGQTILDPFVGSGTTMVACDREGVNGIGIDREVEYIRIAERRTRGDAPLFANVEVA